MDRLRALVQGELNRIVGQIADKLGEEPRGRRDGARLLDLCAEPVGNADLEIGRLEAQTAAFGAEQNVRKDRQRALRRNRVAHDGDTTLQILLQTGKLHTVSALLYDFAANILLNA